jgi:hypothetical protein
MLLFKLIMFFIDHYQKVIESFSIKLIIIFSSHPFYTVNEIFFKFIKHKQTPLI